MNRETILESFKVLILDADGVFFDGNETRFVLPDGSFGLAKTRYYPDGQGISFLRAIGIRILFATREGEPLGNILEKLNNLPSVRNGSWAPIHSLQGKIGLHEKSHSISAWLKVQGYAWHDCVYIGDDRNDIEPGTMAALFVAPADAQRVAQRHADLILQKKGGHGAIRAFAEMVLDVRRIREEDLPPA